MKLLIRFTAALAVCHFIPQIQCGDAKVEAEVAPELPLVTMSAAERKAYDRDPRNKLKLDSQPTGKSEKQSKSAGVSYLKAAGQVIGGVSALQGQFPWHLYYAPTAAGLCGGAIISPNWALTAAHCLVEVEPPNPVAWAGGVDRTTSEAGEASNTVSSFIVHGAFGTPFPLLSNDIALLRFDAPWVFSTKINSIRLPRVSQATTTFVGHKPVASGYGRTVDIPPTATWSTVLKQVALPVITNAKCAYNYYSSKITASTMCAFLKWKGACLGDDGGPLQLKENGRYTLIGIVSFFGHKSCNQQPNVFTRVTSFLGWISTNTGIVIAP